MIHHAILLAASRLVPRQRRADWIAEWQAELWYVRHHRTSFCLGAVRDAWWLWRHLPSPRWAPLSNPVVCLGVLAAIALLNTLLAVQLPGARERLIAPPVPDARGVVVISPRGQASEPLSYSELAPIERTATQFESVAYFRVVQQTDGRRVASFSRDFARVLDPSTTPSTYLPGDVDTWKIDSDAPRADEKVFVLARTRSSAGLPLRWRFSVPTDGGYTRYECTSIDKRPPWFTHLFILAVALVILPIGTSLTMGSYPSSGLRPSLRVRLRWWVFQTAKVILLVVIVFFGNLALSGLTGMPLQVHGWLIGYGLALRWGLLDQRQRCPVCLQGLAHPAHMGSVGQTFLDWCGTELACPQGHGLLHLPEIEASYTTRRWHHLDASWAELFAKPAR